MLLVPDGGRDGDSGWQYPADSIIGCHYTASSHPPGGESGVNISRREGGRGEAKVHQVGSTDGCLRAGGVKFKVRGGDIKPLKGRRRHCHCR